MHVLAIGAHPRCRSQVRTAARRPYVPGGVRTIGHPRDRLADVLVDPGTAARLRIEDHLVGKPAPMAVG
jgi:hypothetical protein